ncbi:MAG TPA: hypothetical protein PK144_15360, partial [Plasticicumulans sp.]|nr:hypothetical protein [Plasticicumulans sp.]
TRLIAAGCGIRKCPTAGKAGHVPEWHFDSFHPACLQGRNPQAGRERHIDDSGLNAAAVGCNTAATFQKPDA